MNKDDGPKSEERVPFSLFHAAIEREKEEAVKQPGSIPEEQEELDKHE